jgi:hypothetical protein
MSFFAVLAIAIAIVTSVATAQQNQSSGPETIVLFDGKTLAGWKKTEFIEAGEPRVEDGAIALPVGGEMTGITTTRIDLPRKNYELTYEARRTKGEDFFAAATFPVGDSYLTFVNGGWGGSITGLSSIDGMDASQNETGKFVKYQNGKWYRFRIRVTARTVTCWVDDEQVASLNCEDRRLGTRLESRPSQPLGFASWDTAGAVKKIEIRALTAAEIEKADKAAAKPAD